MASFKGIGKTPFMQKLTYFLMLNAGILMLTCGIYFFKAPNGFATGGVSGISILLEKLLPILDQADYVLIINSILLVLGVIILGKQCGLLTIFSSLVYSFENFLFEKFLPIESIPGAVIEYAPDGSIISCTLTQWPLLDLIFAVMLTGIGSAIIFRCNASSGGTDIVALILKKYTSMNVGTALLCSDFVIAASSIFIYDLETGLFSLLGLFAKVFVVDDILDSMNMCKAFTIITTKPDQIREYILTEMHRGATIQDGEGSFSHEEKKVIITVCKRSEALKLRRKVKEIDPSAFMIITKTSEIMGKGFRDV